MKIKSSLCMIVSVIILILMGIFTYKVLGETAKNLADSAVNNTSLFWDIKKGETIDENGIMNAASNTHWLCLSHEKVTGLGSASRIDAIMDINISKIGTYSTQVLSGAESVTNEDCSRNKTIKRIAYHIWAASVDTSRGMVGDAGSSPSKNALYYFFNTTDLTKYIGDFAKKRTDSYLKTSKEHSGKVLDYAWTYANSETTGSSADITSSSGTGAEVTMSKSTNGNTYSYIGPFKITTSGTIESVTIKDGNNSPTVAGYANSVGGGVGNIANLPKNGNPFYIVTTDLLTNTNVSVTINTSGTSGGGTIIDPRTGKSTIGYIKARIIFIGNNEGQATTIFRGDLIKGQPSSDTVTFTAKNNLGKMTIQKVGAYAGNEDYENVRDFGFKLYYLDGTTKKYLRINDSDTISGKASVSISGDTKYDADANTATTIFTSSNGTISIDNISVEHEYYIEESNTDDTNYSADIINATTQIGTGPVTELETDGNIAGPIEVELKGANNTATKVMLKDYRKTGDLTIEKVDKDEHNTGLANVEFKLKNKDTGYYVVAEQTAEGEYNILDQLKGYTQNEEDATIFVTNASGTIKITGLDIGNYEIIETNIPIYGYKVLTESISTTLETSGTTVTIENEKQTGNLIIQKKDADSEDIKLEGVSFKLRRVTSNEYLGSGYVIGMQGDSASNATPMETATGTVHFANMAVTDNLEEATTFVTDAEGFIRIYNILIGEYVVEEISVGDNYGYYVNPDYVNWEIRNSNGETSIVNNATSVTVEVVRQKSTDTSLEAAQQETNATDNVVAINEKQTGNLMIQKKDPDNDDLKLEGVSFRIRRITSNECLGAGYVIGMQGDSASNATPMETASGTVYFANMSITDNPEEATTFVTDENGIIRIYNILTGIYEIEEISFGDNYGYDIDPDYVSWEINSNGNITEVSQSLSATVEVTRQVSTDTSSSAAQDEIGNHTLVTAKNTRKYIKISGYAWEDIPWEEGKTTDTNQLYQDTADDINDKLLENITVKLRDNEGNIVQFKDEAGNLVDETRTNSNGKYTMVDVLIDDLDKYYIEFSYNGMAYESVYIIDITNPNGTDAIEGDNRTIFNENFAQITAGQSNNSGGIKINDIQYNTENYKSTINYEGEYLYGYSDEQIEEIAPYTGITIEDYKTYYPVNGVADKYIISSTTYNAYTSVGQSGYLSDIISADEIRGNGITELGSTFEEGINLGLKKRERPDLSVVKDVESAKVSIVGTQHVYKYGDRFNEELWAENSNGVSGHDLDPQVKFEEKYAEMTYSRPLYASDVYYDGLDDEEIRVEMTYKISVKNNSTNLGASIYELDDYFDSKYNLVAIGTDINADGSIMNGTEITDYVQPADIGNDYKKMTIGGNNRAILQLEPLQEKFVYVVLEVNKYNIIDIVESEDNEYAKLDNISEIKTYGVTKVNDNGQAEVYAGIDKDSQPGNTDVNDRTTWEDDTDKAPGMLLILTEEPEEPVLERQVNGKVFLDTDMNSLDEGKRVHTGVARQGNGQYDDSEKGIQNVKVTLLDTEGNIAQVYNEETQTYDDGVTYTNENGEYTIGGFIPGEYHIQYTWGGNIDGNGINSTYTLDTGDQQIVNVQNYKSTIVNETVWNAKGTEDKWYHDRFKQNYPGLEWDTDTNTEIRASDAVDNYDTRLAIDSEIGDMTYGEKQKLENTYDESSTGDKYTNTQMNSTTQNFNVYIEYEDTENIEDNITDRNIEEVNTVNSIDFGIIERAKQLLELDKEITGVKITLANSNVIVNAQLQNGQLINNAQYTTVIPPSNANNGQVKVEIDQELIQGATLNVEYGLKVTNSSELDYQTQEFYMYGVGHGENESAMVTLQPSLIIDYIDSNMLIGDSNSNSWNAVAQENRADYLYDENSNPDGLLTKDLEDTLNSSIRVITTEQLKDNVLKPVGNENETSITAVLDSQRLLSNNDETFVENNAEIIKVKRNNGGSVLITTPGNYVPSDSSTSEEDDSVSPSVTIVPPTGTTTNTISYVIVVISSLAIVVAGIILIKRFVLK